MGVRLLPGLRGAITGKDLRSVVEAHTGGGVEGKVLTSGAWTQGYSIRTWGTEGRADNWDMATVITQGFERSIWVFRCVQKMSGDQSSLPFRFGRGIGTDDEETLDDHPLYRVLNKRANPLETGKQFRKRLSAQVLLSKRGAFVEVTRSRLGTITRLDLLAPDRCRPIPDPRGDYLSHFEFIRSDGQVREIDPEKIRWIRDPHPTDPFSGVTPLEAAGISVELDFLMRTYNVTFLKNDGKPGGIVAIDADMMTEQQIARVEAKLRPGPHNAGHTALVGTGPGGMNYVDLATKPRDMAYQEATQNAKTEILAAFGIGESLLGNASDRCLRASELVRLADGRRVRAGDLVDTKFQLMTSTPDGHAVSEAWATLENVATIYRITTESGRTLETNGKHPLYAATHLTTREAGWRSANGPRIDVKGWTPVARLADAPEAGKWLVAVPTRVTPASAGSTFTPDHGFVLGALVGDGSISAEKGHVALTTPAGDFADAFASAAAALGDVVTKYDTKRRVDTWGVKASPENRIGSGRGARDACRTRALLRQVGLLGTTSHTKFIPEQVFGSSDETLAAFLGGLFAADGCVLLGKPGKKTPRGSASIVLVTVSEALARGTQEALLRFSVNAKLRRRANKGGLPSMEGKVYSSWELSISRSTDVLAFTEAIRVPGKQEKLDEAADRARDALRAKPHGGNVHTWRTRDLNPDLAWEKVASVETVGTDQTIGIMVPGHHTYLSVLWEHNTFDNAEQERFNYWAETELPHLDLLASAFADDIDGDDAWEPYFDTARVDALDLPRRQARSEARDEFNAGLRSIDEYRPLAGLDPVNNAQTRALWVSPQKAPIPTRDGDAAALGADQGATGGDMPPGAAGQQPGQQPGAGGSAADAVQAAHQLDQPGGGDGGGSAAAAVAAAQAVAGGGVPGQAAAAVQAAQALEHEGGRPGAAAAVVKLARAKTGGAEGKSLQSGTAPVTQPQGVVHDPGDGEESRTQLAVSGALDALLARQLGVVTARLQSPKTRRGTRFWQERKDADTGGDPSAADPRVGDAPVDASRVIDSQRWQQDTQDTVAPVAHGAAGAAALALLTAFAAPGGGDAALLAPAAAFAGARAALAGTAMATEAMAAWLDRVRQRIDAEAVTAGSMDDVIGAVRDEYGQRAHAFSQEVAQNVAHTAVVGARDEAADALTQPGQDTTAITRTWLTRADSQVRPTHAAAAGQKRRVGDPFVVGGTTLRYPGDPFGAPQETVNCRCRLAYQAAPGARFTVAGTPNETDPATLT